MVETDDWTVLSSGVIAFLRGRDYHVDVIDSTGERTVSPPISFAWRRISDDVKRQIVDSVRVAAEVIASRSSSPQSAELRLPSYLVGGVEELPDYYPAFASGALRADNSDRMWLRTTTRVSPDCAVYDVIDRGGQLINRITLPRESAIAGFGMGHSLFVAQRDSSGIVLQRVSER